MAGAPCRWGRVWAIMALTCPLPVCCSARTPATLAFLVSTSAVMGLPGDPPAGDPPPNSGAGGPPTITTVARDATNGNNDLRVRMEIHNLDNHYYLAHVLGSPPGRLEVRRMGLVARPTDTPNTWLTPAEMVAYLGQWTAAMQARQGPEWRPETADVVVIIEARDVALPHPRLRPTPPPN